LSDESLFREVDEEVRNEQLQKLWEKYGVYVISACIGVIVAVGGIKGWQAYQQSVAETAGDEYIRAISLLQKDDAAEAERILSELASDGPTGYAALANFQMAAVLAEKGQVDTAIKAYDTIAADSGLDDMLRNLARIRAGLLAVESVSLQDVETRLGDLNTRDNPWRNAAREIIALAAYKAGDAAMADRLYTEIIGDLSAPQGLRERAQVMLTLLQPRLQTEPAQN
jgi:hypothetical protein